MNADNAIRHTLCKKKGFTLLEALLIITILSVIVIAISPIFRTVVVGREEQDRRLELFQVGRVGLDEMVRNLKTATVFTKANASKVKFDDWNSDSIEYKKGGSALKKNNKILAKPINSLVFTYYDSDGDTTTAEEDVSSIKIAMTMTDSEGKTSPVTMEALVVVRQDPAAPIDVAINEINYNPPGKGANERKNEWVEIYNYGASAIDVNDWEIEGDSISGSAGTTTIPAGGYGIIAAEPTQVYTNYAPIGAGAVRLTVGDNAIGNGLNNNSETINLENDTGVEVDAVTYDDAWGGDGDGDTLERKDATTLPSDSSNWEASSDTSTYTCGSTNTTS